MIHRIFWVLFLYEHKHIGRISNLRQCTFNLLHTYLYIIVYILLVDKALYKWLYLYIKT